MIKKESIIQTNEKTILELLKINKYEEFKLIVEHTKSELPQTFRIGENLIIEYKFDFNSDKWYKSSIELRELLIGTYIVERLPFGSTLTKEEKLIIAYLKSLGFNWLAIDSSDTVLACEDKPYKTEKNGKVFWFNENNSNFKVLPFSAIYLPHFHEDNIKKPFHIGSDRYNFKIIDEIKNL
jgi:hypothetical protein